MVRRASCCHGSYTGLLHTAPRIAPVCRSVQAVLLSKQAAVLASLEVVGAGACVQHVAPLKGEWGVPTTAPTTAVSLERSLVAKL